MNQWDPINSINAFSAELLNAKIVDRDQLIRIYNAKCIENSQIQGNLNSITDTAQQIRQLYTDEKDRNQRLKTANADLGGKLQCVEKRLETVENERINNDTLYKQTIAELEEQLEKSNKKYLELCESYVEQANILHGNHLFTTPLARKCTAIRDILQDNGIPFEWNKSPTKSKTKLPIAAAAAEKVRSNKISNATATRSFGMQTDLTMTTMNEKIVSKQDKATQYHQSKATRSTCTSAFIQTVDCSTNTTDELSAVQPITLNAVVDAILDDLPPAAEQQQSTPSKATNSTQTFIPNYRTQGTLTQINNVRKRINYVRAPSKSNSIFHEVKKEECLSPCPSPVPLNSFISMPSILSQNDPLRLSAQFHNIWQLLGELLCRIAGQPKNVPVDDNLPNEMQIIQKIYEIKHLMGDKAYAAYAKAMENIDIVDDSSSSEMPLDDGHDEQNSRDSIESYSSAKVHIAKIRNLSNCSPSMLHDENAIEPVPMDIDRTVTFKPIVDPNTVNQTNVQITEPIVSIQSSFLPPPKIDAIDRNPSSKHSTESHAKEECASNSIAPMVRAENDDAAHFKVPKRKSASKSQSDMRSVKKRKAAKVSIKNN